MTFLTRLRFLVRPQLLTRVYLLLVERGIYWPFTISIRCRSPVAPDIPAPTASGFHAH
jgi:hypothetical protein